MPRLEFSNPHVYSSPAEGIAAPVVLKKRNRGARRARQRGYGCKQFLFAREHGEMLNFEIETGAPKTFWTANGAVRTFGHLVEIQFAGLSVESTVYFFADEQIRRNLLGRTGRLDRVRLGLVHHDLSLDLAPYDFGQE